MAAGIVNAGYWLTEGSLSAIDIDVDLYTHLLAAFADLHDETFEVFVPHSKLEKILTFPYIIKHRTDSVKTLLSIGGDGAKPEAFSNMVRQPTTRQVFIESSVRSAREYQYDGLDLHWLYPSSDWNMRNLGLLLREWSDAARREAETTGKPRLLLVASVYHSPYPNSFSYPVQEMASYLDWINVMAYDFETPQSSPKITKPPSPFIPCVIYGLDEWINKQGFPSFKTVLVIPFHGWAWNLENPDEHGISAPATGPAKGQEGISDEGLASYKSIRNLMSKFSATEDYDVEGVVTSFCYYGNVWIGYDGDKCVAAKISRARELGLMGYATWHVGGDTDDSVLANTASREWNKWNCQTL